MSELESSFSIFKFKGLELENQKPEKLNNG